MQNHILVGIMLTLLNRKKVSAKELAAKYEISYRTTLRYVDTLLAADVPVLSTTGPNGGYSIADDFCIDNFYFTKDEFQRIINSLLSYPTVPDDKTTQLIVDKLLHLGKNIRSNFILRSDQLLIDVPLNSIFKNKFSLIEECIIGYSVIRLSYKARNGEITVREVEPHALVHQDNLWYLYGYCRLRKQFRMFKISRIGTIQLLDEKFSPRKFQLEQHKQEQLEAMKSNVDFCLWVSDNVKNDVEEWIGITNLTSSNDGSIATASLPFDKELVGKILSFGKDVRVISPQKLKDSVVEMLNQCLSTYS